MTSPNRTESRQKWRRRFTGVAVLVVGLSLLGMADTGFAQGASEPSPPYRYVMGDTVPASDLGPLAPLAKKHIPVHKAKVMSADGRQLAGFEVADSKHGPVLLQWQPDVDAPFLTVLPLPKEVTDLAPVLERHVPHDGTVFAWWDTSREFRLLAGVKVAFGEHLGEPLFLPPKWQKTEKRIKAIETDFWKPQPDKAERARFQRFVHALLSNEKQGVAELNQLAGDKPAVIVLHVRDIITLGQMAPDKIGVAFQDFPNGDVHQLARGVRAWVKENGYPSYAIIRERNGSMARVVALTDKASGETLAARLLPFLGNDLSTVPGTILVYRTDGFWVYELGKTPPQVTSNNH